MIAAKEKYREEHLKLFLGFIEIDLDLHLKDVCTDGDTITAVILRQPSRGTLSVMDPTMMIDMIIIDSQEGLKMTPVFQGKQLSRFPFDQGSSMFAVVQRTDDNNDNGV